MAAESWDWRCTNKLYFRRSGAHCCCASPITRMSPKASREIWAVSGLTSVVREPGSTFATVVEDDGELFVSSVGS